MRPWLSLALGALIGQWLAFSGTTSPADVHALGMLALERQDYAEAARIWTRAVSLHPDNPTFHYLRGTALARLGHSASAVDAFQQTLLLEPSAGVATLASQRLAQLTRGDQAAADVTIPLEAARGVWVAHVTLNDGPTGRFLVDTGASVTLVSPRLARQLALTSPLDVAPTSLHTVAGPTTGASTALASVRLGAAEARNVSAVIHDPGIELDGILGNSFLGRFVLTLDADRKLLHLRTPVR